LATDIVRSHATVAGDAEPATSAMRSTATTRQLFISREFPPASYPAGGIGTYCAQIVRLLAAAGQTVHVIGERWSGAPLARQELESGRLIVHRVRQDEPLAAPGGGLVAGSTQRLLRLLGGAPPRAQRFAWQAALLAERIVEAERIDIIEAQEWEAPLYYFLLRRALGLGPVRQPPCVIHLHSPTEFIYRHNEWVHDRRDRVPLVRFEEYCIRAADALLCPSRYLAQQIAAHYRVPVDDIGVIPYPAGDFPFVERDPASWSSGRIVYVGRLEARKGLIEFIDAAVDVARTDALARFDFVGEDGAYRDGLTVRQYMERRIPRSLRRRFAFHHVQPRDRLPAFLGRARAAVVPSRWDNLPNTCLEAMRSGLPVIASPQGGMAEIVEDGVTGWIAPSQSADGLAIALRRALATAPADCRAMGRAAAAAIRSRFDNATLVRLRLEMLRDVVARGVVHSTHMPHMPGIQAQRGCAVTSGTGLAFVVEAKQGASAATAQASIRALDSPPQVVIVIESGADESLRVRALSAAATELIERADVAGVTIIDGATVLAPDFVSACTAVLERDPTVGIVSGWVVTRGGGFVRPCPAFPYQWIANDVADVAVIRAEAFLEAGGLRPDLPLSYARWDLANAVIASGWRAVTWPGVLAEADTHVHRATARDRVDPFEQMLRERLPGRFTEDRPLLAGLTPPAADRGGHSLRALLRLPLRRKAALALAAVRDPRRLIDWFRIRAARRR